VHWAGETKEMETFVLRFVLAAEVIAETVGRLESSTKYLFVHHGYPLFPSESVVCSSDVYKLWSKAPEAYSGLHLMVPLQTDVIASETALSSERPFVFHRCHAPCRSVTFVTPCPLNFVVAQNYPTYFDVFTEKILALGANALSLCTL
jgi:hypothetical protein